MEENKDVNSARGLDEETFGGFSNTSREEIKTETVQEEKKVYIPGYDNVEGLSNSQMNYYTGTAIKEPQKKEGKALEICALVFGILGIVGCCCYGIFGVVGLVLSIVALATGKKNGLSIAALICSIVGILATACIFAYSLSDAGREASREFLEAYDRTYGETSEQSLDDDYGDTEEAWSVTPEDEEEDDSATSENYKVVNEGSSKNKEASAKEAGMITIYGQTIEVPCKVSDVKKVFEISSDEQKTSMETYDSLFCNLVYKGEEIPVEIYATNETGEKINSIDAATISNISVRSDEGQMADAEFFGGVKIGMTNEEVEKQLSEYEYTIYKDGNYMGYDLMIGDTEYTYITIMVEDGRVYSISVAGYE